MSRTINKPRTAGFRFSRIDAVALMVCAVASTALYRLQSDLWWLLLIVAGHFFLFCNVFRIARRRELLWAAGFLVNVGVWAWLGRLTWLNVLACQLPISLAVIGWEIRSPYYHGVFAYRVNPSLDGCQEGKLL